MLTPVPGFSIQYSMTEVMICLLAASDFGPIGKRRDFVRSMQDRTWENDLEPMKRIEVTSASVDGINGSSTPREAASVSIAFNCS